MDKLKAQKVVDSYTMASASKEILKKIQRTTGLRNTLLNATMGGARTARVGTDSVSPQRGDYSPLRLDKP